MASKTPAATPQRESVPRSAAPSSRAPAGLLQRVHRGAGNGVVQRLLASRNGGLRVPAGVTREVERRRGRGRPLEPRVRERMEQTVGADLGSVRVHTDRSAHNLTESLEARAFTSGSDVFFSRRSYRPDSSDGRRLLAHELTHVAQQAAGRVPGASGEIRPPGDTLEREAESTAQRSVAAPSRPAGRRRRNGGLQRQEAAEAAPAAGAPLPTTTTPPAAAPEEEGGFWASVRNLGAGARAAWAELSDVASEWAPKIIGFLTNPVGALLGHSWLELPDRFKPRILNTILEYSEAIFERIQDVFAVVLGPLWVVVRHFMLGFLRRMKEVPDALKVALSNRLALLMTGGSLTFLLHFAKGLALGIWDVIRLPYDLVLLVIDGVQWISDWLGRKSGDEQLTRDQQDLQSESQAPESDPGEELSTPQLALQFVKLIWDSITGAVEQMGRGLSQALLDFFQLPDEQMGEQTGRLAGGIAVDVVLAAVTAGIAAVLRRVAATAVQVVRLIKVFAKARKILTLIKNVVLPLVGGIRKAVTLFRYTRFARTLKRFGKWVDRAFKALFAADVAITLHEKGAAPDEEVQAEDEEEVADEADTEVEAEEVAPEAAGTRPEEQEEPEYVDLDLLLEESEVLNPSPEDLAALGLEADDSEPLGGEAILREPIQLVQKPKVKSGTALENDVIKALLQGRIKGVPKMRFALLGQHTRSGHGIDVYCGYRKKGRLYLFRIEVKGGFVVKLGRTRAGTQGGPGWTKRKIAQLFGGKRTDIKKELIKNLIKKTGIKNRRVLKARLFLATGLLIHHRKTKLPKRVKKQLKKLKVPGGIRKAIKLILRAKRKK